MWSRKHDKCINCGTIETEHCGHGLCNNCFLNFKYETNKEFREKAKERATKWAKDNKERVNLRNARWAENNPEKSREIKERWKRKSRKTKNGLEGWSFNYDNCINCGTNSIKHYGKGLCSLCYFRQRRQKPEYKIKRKTFEDSPKRRHDLRQREVMKKSTGKVNFIEWESLKKHIIILVRLVKEVSQRLN